MRLTKIILCIFSFFLVYNLIACDMKRDSVLVCYGKLKAENIKGYDYVIVESKHYLASNIRVMKAQNRSVMAYISLGEVNEHAPHYKELQGSTLGKNSIWNSFYLDLRAPKTTEIILKLVDDAFQKGYDGLFLDNLDNFTVHGPQREQKPELLALLSKIKARYPHKQFIQNAGLELAPETAPFIKAIMIESIATAYDFKTKTYKLREKKQFEDMMKHLKSVSETAKIPVYLIEYSDSKKLNKQILERILPSDFDYFIGNINLQTIPRFKE